MGAMYKGSSPPLSSVALMRLHSSDTSCLYPPSTPTPAPFSTQEPKNVMPMCVAPLLPKYLTPYLEMAPLSSVHFKRFLINMKYLYVIVGPSSVFQFLYIWHTLIRSDSQR